MRKLFFCLVLCIGLCVIAFAVLSISNVSITPYNSVLLSLNENAGTNAVRIESDVVCTVADDPQIAFDILAGIRFKYVEINIAEAQYTNLADDSTNCQVLYAYNDHEFIHEQAVWQKLKIGRNFIELPDGEYSAIRVDLTNYGGAVFHIKAINLTSELPLRLRHIIAFVFFGALWGVVCWVLFFYNLRLILDRLHGFKKYSYLLLNLVKKDFTTKYRRSALGVLWSVLNPLLLAMIISTVFSTIFRVQIENFAVYYLTGSLIFNFMSEATNGSLTSILGAAGLIKKVYIPKYIFPLEKCLFALVNTIFTLIATLILMPFLGVSLKPTILLFWVPLFYVLIFSIGLGLILSAANVFFRDVGHLYSVLVTAWMYLTPIIYPAELIPDSVKWFASVNPMFYYVDYFRNIMMYNTVPDFMSNVICAAFAGASFLIGLIVFKRKQDRFILYI